MVAVVERDGAFLIIERGPDVPLPGYWTPPSGGIDPGESPEEALVREMREELGIAVNPIREVWRCPADGGVDYELLWWLAELVDGEPTPDGSEVTAVRWLTPSEMHDVTPTFPADHEFFDEVWPRLAGEAS